MPKNSIKKILFGIVIFLMFLPLLATVNSFLTHTLDTSGWYKPIQNTLVPFEAKLVMGTLKIFKIDTRIYRTNANYSFSMIKEDELLDVDLAWNCLGWQSMLILILSLIFGMKLKYSNVSRLECIIFGLFGTLLINVIRMSAIAIGSYYMSDLFALIIHDYFAVLISALWIMFFWWFSYQFVLEEGI